MVCPSCLAQNPKGASRCAGCGSPLAAAPAEPPPARYETPSGGHRQSSPQEAATAVGFAQTPPPSSSATSSAGSAISQAKPVDFGPRYEVQALLGEGGMGAVYRAYDRELDRIVALKLIRPELGSDPAITQRFRQELLLASKVSHKNILRIHDLGEANGTKFISMAYVEGEDLHQLLKREGRLPVSRAVSLTKQLCAALEAAHAEGVVHRDLKPQNILLDKAGQVYVSDFGLAKSLAADATQVTVSGQFLGTPRYMSPEQALAAAVDYRSDLYSLGLIVYEMVTGDIPFKADSTLQTMYLRVHEKPQDPRQINPDLPDYLVQIIMRCLETEPAQRYQSAREILDDLESAQPSRPPSRPLPAVKRSSRRLWYAGAVVLLLALLAALTAPGVRKLLRPGPSSAQSSLGIPPASQGKYLALLPFRVIGDKNALGYVSDGLVEATAAKLFQMKDIHLASPTAVQSVNVDQPLEKIARQLGVNLIAQGTVQGTAAKMRITISLDDVAAGKRLWTSEFSGVPQDLLTLEDQIYARLLTAIEGEPSKAGLANAASHPTENVQAYDLYLRGRNALRGQQNVNNLNTALRLFEEALKTDPNFALAYTGMADASMRMYREKKERFWSDKALAAAEQAKQLNSNLPEVHLVLGSIYAGIGRTSESLSELKQALEMAPNSDEVYRRLGDAYMSTGHSREAVPAFQKALQINPYYWQNSNSLGLAYFDQSDYENSVKAFRRVIELEPDNGDGYNNLASAFLQAGKFQDAIEPLQKALQLTATGDSYSNLGIAYFYLKQYDRAITYYQKAVELAPNSVIFVGNLAEAYRCAGQKQQAQSTYDKAISLAYQDLQVNPRDALTMGALALWSAEKGDTQQGLRFIQRARAINSADVNLLYYQAQIYALANDRSGALHSLEEAFSRGLRPAIAEAEPDLASLRTNPEFNILAQKYSHQ